MAYNKDAITSSTPIRQYPTLLTNNFTAIVTGDYTLTSPTISQSSVNLYKITGSPSDPEKAANMGRIYTKEVSSRVAFHYLDDLGNVTQLTDYTLYTNANPGSVFIGQNMLLQYGNVTISDTAQIYTITFPKTFATVYSANINIINTSSGITEFLMINTLNAGNVTFRVYNKVVNPPLAGSRTFTWTAVGSAY